METYQFEALRKELHDIGYLLAQLLEQNKEKRQKKKEGEE